MPPTHPLWSQEAHSKVAAPVSVTCALGVSAGSLAPRLPALPTPESPRCYDAEGNSRQCPSPGISWRHVLSATIQRVALAWESVLYREVPRPY